MCFTIWDNNRQNVPRFAKFAKKITKIRKDPPRLDKIHKTVNIRKYSPKYTGLRQNRQNFTQFPERQIRPDSPRFANIRQDSPRYRHCQKKNKTNPQLKKTKIMFVSLHLLQSTTTTADLKSVNTSQNRRWIFGESHKETSDLSEHIVTEKHGIQNNRNSASSPAYLVSRTRKLQTSQNTL